MMICYNFKYPVLKYLQINSYTVAFRKFASTYIIIVITNVCCQLFVVLKLSSNHKQSKSHLPYQVAKCNYFKFILKYAFTYFVFYINICIIRKQNINNVRMTTFRCPVQRGSSILQCKTMITKHDYSNRVSVNEYPCLTTKLHCYK